MSGGVGKAAVMVRANAPFEMREYPIPDVGPGCILVKVLCCTICRSDHHTYSGKRSGPVPLILGHEIVGEIVDLGDGVSCDSEDRPLAIGERITWTLTDNCGRCYYCRVAGLPMKCMSLYKYGHDSCADAPHFNGGFAEYCFLRPGTSVVAVPDALTNEVAAPANCAVATVLACLEEAAPAPGGSILIQGAGGLGNYAAAAAQWMGCGTIIVSDYVEAKLDLVRRFGATDTVNLADCDDLETPIRELTQGRGVDCVLEVSGAPEAVADGLGVLRKGGRYVEAGCSYSPANVTIDMSVILWNRISLIGVHNYHARHLNSAIQFLASTQHELPFHELITSRYPLDNIDQAMAAAGSGDELRVAVVP